MVSGAACVVIAFPPKIASSRAAIGDRPRFVDKFEDYGIKLHPSVFDPGRH